MITTNTNNATYSFTFTGTPQIFHAYPGLFRIQLWGASGILSIGAATDGCSKVMAKGSYVSGIINIKSSFDMYIYIGEKGKSNSGTFNGNLPSTVIPGGGATDVRLTKTDNWYDFDSLKSRIMVAAGAGSGERICGGDGGNLIGISTDQVYEEIHETQTRLATGGTQTSGGKSACERYFNMCAENGSFGIGGSGNNEKDDGPSGGGGYYGGGGVIWAGSAGGGSSFISGYEGCDAIYENSTENHIYHTGRPLHYSGKYFTDAIMIDGQSSMPSTDLKRYEIGHTGDGYALITYIGSNLIYSCLINTYFLNYFLLSNFHILIS